MLEGLGALTGGAGVDAEPPPGAGAVTVGALVAGEALGVAGLNDAWACRLQRSKSACVGVAVCPEATLPIASRPAAAMNAVARFGVDIRFSFEVWKVEHSRGVQVRCQGHGKTS
jgi:hypothetical protein